MSNTPKSCSRHTHAAGTDRKAEVADFLAQQWLSHDRGGRQRVLRRGDLPNREVMTETGLR
jgi:hypothetical protein